jgi:acyl-CoA thioesterase
MADATLAALTAVELVGENRYRSEPGDDLGIMGGMLNGGAVLEIAARALAGTLDRPHPVTITGHFLSPARAGALDITTDVLRTGRHGTGRAMVAGGDGAVILAVTGTFTDLAGASGPTQRLTPTAAAPDRDTGDAWPPPGGRPADTQVPPRIMDRFTHRLIPDGFGWARGEPRGDPVVEGWARPASGTWDPLDLLTLADVYPPPLLNTGLGFVWVPTLELTVHVRGLPRDDEWVMCRFSSSEVTDGYVEEDGVLRGADGRLLAMSRQLSLAPTRGR